MTSEPKSSWGEVFCSCLPWTRQRSSSDLAVPLNQVAPDGNEPQSADNAVRRSNSDPNVSLADIATGSGKPRPTDDAGQRSISDPTAPSTSRADHDPSAEPRLADSVAWGATKLAMEGLQEALDVFPPLKAAVGGFLGCMTQLQASLQRTIADQNRQEYERLMSSLAHLAGLLQKYLSDSKPTYMPYSIGNVAGAIEAQVRHIQQRQNRPRTSRLVVAKEDEDDVLRCYRRVEALFQQLQADISLSIWDVVREEQMETRLQRLMPADDAWYNSALTETMTKRRGCTANTRTKVLADAQDWTRYDDAAKIYWMNGMAGTGKTTIAYSLCKMLEEAKQLGASFFCSRDSPSCRNVSRIVPTIAYQLARYSNAYRQALCEALGNNLDVAKKDIETQFENLITKPLGVVRKALPTDVVVVVDALDECSDIDGTRQVLDLLFRHTIKLPIKFFITSRPEPGISDKIITHDDASRSILRLHDIERSLVQEDIQTYLTEALSSVRLLPGEIEQLAARAGSLFIFASTAVRYILPSTGSINHRQRLAAVLGLDPNPGNKSYRDIDKLYLTIISSALDKERLEDREATTRQLVLWTAICAREPLTMAAIAELLGLQEEEDMRLAIQPFQSVLHVSESTGVVSTLHASFPDFLLSKERAGPLMYCDQKKHNEHLTSCCFELMKQSLRFNICGLETSYVFDRDVPNIQSRIDGAVSTGLFYACRYWGDHLIGTTASVTLSLLLGEFLRHRLLFWIEVLSLKGWIWHGESVFSQVLGWLRTEPASADLQQFTYDARNFITICAVNPTSLSTPHIYLSVLPFTSKQSHVWVNYWPRTRGLLQVKGTGIEAWNRAPLARWQVDSESSIRRIAQSSDGKRVVSGASDGTVSIWDVSKATCIVGPLHGHEIKYHSLWLHSHGTQVAFSPDDERIVSGSEDCTIRIWDAHNGSLIAGPLRGHTGPVNTVAFSQDESRFVSGSDDHTIRIWDARDGMPLGEAFKGHKDAVNCVALSPDSQRVVSGSSDHSVRIWDLNTSMTIVGPLEGHTDRVRAVAFSRDGQRVMSGSDDCTIRMWDAHSGTMLAGPFQGHTGPVMSVAFSFDDKQIVSGSSDRTICVWDAENGTVLAGPLEGHHDRVNSVLFSPDGTRVLSGSDDGTICVWDARHGTMAAAKSSGNTNAICDVAFSPDGARAVSGSGDLTIRVWDTDDGRLAVGPLEGHTGNVNSVAFSPDGARIVSGSSDLTLRTWDARNGTLIGSFEGHSNAVLSVAFSPDGSQIASGSSDRTIQVWDSQTGTLAVGPFEGHTDWVGSVAFSPDGTRIISGSGDSTVRMWNVLKGTPIWTSNASAHTRGVNCVRFSPDGTRVVSGSNDCTILVLNALDGMVLLGPFQGHADWVWSVAFSPDGTRIVSGSRDCTVCVWDAQNGMMVSGPLRGHIDLVLSVAFSPDGRRIVSGSEDDTIRFWEVATAGNSHPSYLDRCTLRDDGWMTDSESHLLVWLPLDVRYMFPLLPCSGVISERIIVTDYSNLPVGERWNECYQDLPATTTP